MVAGLDDAGRVQRGHGQQLVAAGVVQPPLGDRAPTADRRGKHDRDLIVKPGLAVVLGDVPAFRAGIAAGALIAGAAGFVAVGVEQGDGNFRELQRRVAEQGAADELLQVIPFTARLCYSIFQTLPW